MSDKINVNKNAMFNTIKSISGIIYPLITFPYISRVLMAENVGKINFGNSIVSYFSLIASLGVIVTSFFIASLVLFLLILSINLPNLTKYITMITDSKYN